MLVVEVCVRRFGLRSFFRDAQGPTPKSWFKREFDPTKTKSAAIAALLRLSYCYIQSSRLEGVNAPCFEALYSGWNQQLSQKSDEKGY